MKEITGNIWDFHTPDNWVVIPTNGFVKKNGEAVMGAGLAKQGASKYPDIPAMLGHNLRMLGNQVHMFSHPYYLITFPVKHNWMDKADPELIARSTGELIKTVDSHNLENIYLPRVGCGNGRLIWADVKPLLKRLDDRFTVVWQPGL